MPNPLHILSRMNIAREQFVRNLSSQTKKRLKGVRICVEILVATATCFALVVFMNWVVVTLNILGPKDLEKIMKWRAFITRSVWLLYMTAWGVWNRRRALIQWGWTCTALLVSYALSFETVQYHVQAVGAPTRTQYDRADTPVKPSPLVELAPTAFAVDIPQSLQSISQAKDAKDTEEKEAEFRTEGFEKADKQAVDLEKEAAAAAAQKAADLEKEAAAAAAKKAADLEKEAARTRLFSAFFIRRTIFMARVTCPAHPNAVVQCEIETPTKSYIKARPPSTEPDASWTEQQFEHVFSTTATNEEVFKAVRPISFALKTNADWHMCLGVDGFSGSGKSHTLEGLLAILADDLMNGELPNNKRVVFEAFQTLGTEIESLDIAVTEKQCADFDKGGSDLALQATTGSMFRQTRPCYVVKTFAGLQQLVAETAHFRSAGATNNNTTSSRSHLAIIIYVAARYTKPSTLCLFDLAGNERQDALEGIQEHIKEKDSSTIKINDSRMKIHAALEAAIAGRKQVTRETALGSLLMMMMVDRHATLTIIFHLSIYTSFSGAVSKTLKDASLLKKARAKFQRR